MDVNKAKEVEVTGVGLENQLSPRVQGVLIGLEKGGWSLVDSRLDARSQKAPEDCVVLELKPITTELASPNIAITLGADTAVLRGITVIPKKA